MNDCLMDDVKGTIFEECIKLKVKGYEYSMAQENILARLHYVIKDNIQTFYKVYASVEYGDSLYAGKIISYQSDLGKHLWLGVEVKGTTIYITLNEGDMVFFETFYRAEVELDEKDVYKRDWFETIIREFFAYGYNVKKRKDLDSIPKAEPGHEELQESLEGAS